MNERGSSLSRFDPLGARDLRVAHDADQEFQGSQSGLRYGLSLFLSASISGSWLTAATVLSWLCTPSRHGYFPLLLPLRMTSTLEAACLTDLNQAVNQVS